MMLTVSPAPETKGKQPRVILIGAERALVDRALALGYDPFVIQRPNLVGELTELGIQRYFVCDVESDDAYLSVVTILHQSHRFAGVLSLSERGLIAAARIAETLGLVGLSSEIVMRARDKCAMRAHLETRDFSPMPFAGGSAPEDLRQFGQKLGYPFIAKPRMGVSSRGVTLVRAGMEDEAQKRVGSDFIMEELLNGEQFSIDTFSLAKKHIILAINAERNCDLPYVNQALEVSHQIPAAISATVASEITIFVSQFLDCMGISDGPAHTELFYDQGRATIIETQTRFGGDFIPELIQRTTGVDVLELALKWCLQGERLVVPPIHYSCAGAIRFFTPAPGTVRAIRGLRIAEARPGVIRAHLPLKVGDQIPRIEISGDRPGYVMAVAQSGSEATEVCKRALDDVVFIIDGDVRV